MVKLRLTLESATETLTKLREKGAFVQGDVLEYLIKHPETTVETLKRRFKARASATLIALSKKGLIRIYPLKYTYRKTIFQKAKVFHYYLDAENQVAIPYPNPFSRLGSPTLPEDTQKLLTSGKLFLKEISLEKITLPKPEPEYLIIEGTPADREEMVLDKIRKAIQQGGQVLFLSSRLYHTYYWKRRLFTETGRRPLHWSEYKNLDQRLKDWEEIRLGAKKIIVGGLRSLFLPYKNLQLVVFDEIDSGNFKTFTSPRMDTKDCLEFIRANNLSSAIVTSSVKTPLLLYLQTTEQYQYFNTTKDPLNPPFIIPQRDRDSYYPEDTLKKIKETLNNSRSVLYFQNRRGFYTVYLCRKCSYQAKCPNCQINLVYHLKTGRLHCHTCEFSTTIKEKCPNCFEGDMVLLGVGTQRISEELKSLFQVDTLRIDADSLNEIGRREILNKLRDTRPLLVVGTEAVFSFLYDYKPDFCVYGNPDLNLNLPDYQGEEVVYRNIFLLYSWSGQPIHFLTYRDAQEVQETARDWPRIILEKYRNFDYPPYTRLIMLTLTGADKETVKKEGNLIKSWIDREFKQTINTYSFNIKREGKHKGVVFLRGDIKIAESLRLFDILKSVRDRVKIIPNPSGLMTW
ncbi:MAG: Primosomal protein N' [candidate division WS2 bacterium]|nr:Primosomal protein N' [Candidatus Lithacetigena glycinireducens]